MADYTVRVIAETQEAEEKTKRLERHLDEVSKDRRINLQLPSVNETVENLKALGRAVQTTYSIAKNVPVIGGRLDDLEQLGDIALGTGQKVVKTFQAIASASPTNILGTTFSASTTGALELSKRLSSLGYTVFGVTQSVDLLRTTFGSLFDETVGREIKLQETLLRTKTALASTADVAVNGKRITDPYQAILKLDKPINEAVANIRTRSLEIAGTTSDAIIQVFGVVSSQIGEIGGGLKDAEDLAITFSAALGTLGLSDPFYATQEIRSILTGTIDQNSVLARSLGLTNEEVAKAKTSAEGLVSFLQRRLAAFTAGQSLAAQGFAGIVSNIQEFSEEIKRSLGKGLLDPLLEGLTVLYERLQVVFKSTFGLADALGKSFGAVARGVVGAAAAAPALQGLSQRDMRTTTEGGEQLAIQGMLYVQNQIDKLRPQIAALADAGVRAIAQIGAGLARLAQGFALFKYEQLRNYFDSLVSIANLLSNTVAPAIGQVLSLYGEFLKLPAIQFLSQFAARWDVLNRVGVLPFAKTMFTLTMVVPSVISTFKQLGAAFTWLRSQLAGIATIIIIAVTSAIAAIQNIVLRALGIILEGLTLLLTSAVSLINATAYKLGLALLDISHQIYTTLPELKILVAPLNDIGNALLKVAVNADVAKTKIQDLAGQAAAGLAGLKTTAADVQEKIGGVGDTIKEKIGEAGVSVKSHVLGMIKNFLMFSAQMLILQLAITAAFEVYSRFQAAQKDLSDKTRAELAVKRLSTVYADLGENATSATKALRDYENQIVATRVDTLTKKLGELQDKITALQQEIKKPWNFKLWDDDNITNIPDIGDRTARIMKELEKQGRDVSWNTAKAMAVREKKLEELKAAKAELQFLADFDAKTKANTKAKEDVQIMRKERTVLEKEIKDLRKQYTKDIADFEWEQKNRVLELEQQMRDTIAQQQVRDLERRQQKENQNIGNIAAGFKKALDDYEKTLFDIQTEGERQRFELTMRREELEKSVADYRYRLEEQTLKLREKMGEINKKIVDYESEQRKRTEREVLAYAFKQYAARTGMPNTDMTPDEKRDFLNEAARRGVSAERLLAVQRTSSDPRWLQGSIREQINTMLKPDIGIPGLIRDRSDKEFWEAINTRAGLLLGQSQGGQLIRQTVEADLGTGRFKTTAPPPPPQIQDLDQLLGTNSFISRYSAGLEAKFEKEKEYLALKLRTQLSDAGATLVAVLTDPKTWGITTNSGELDEQIRSIRASFTELDRTIVTGSTVYRGVNGMLQDLASYRQSAAEVMGSKYISAKTGQPTTDYFNKSLQRIDTGVPVSVLVQDLTTPNERVRDAVRALYEGYAQARKLIIETIAPKQLQTDILQQLQAAKAYTIELQEQVTAVQLRTRLEAEGFGSARIDAELRIAANQRTLNALNAEAIKQIAAKNELILKNQELLRSPKLTDAERAALQKELENARAYVKKLEADIAELRKQLGRNADTERGNADKQDDPISGLLARWKKELNDTRALIASLAQTIQSELASAMNNAITGVLNGTTTIGEAFGQMFANIGKAFLDMATQMIAKWMIMQLLGIIASGAGVSIDPGSMAKGGGGGKKALVPRSVFESFAGGGYTGEGARLGGLDGQGGFMAMLHPRETVIDHTTFAGASLGGAVNSVVNVTISDSGTKVDSNQASQFGRMIEASVMSVINREKRPGGALNRR